MKAIWSFALLAVLLTACTGGGHKHSSSASNTPLSPSASPTSAAVLPPAQAAAIDSALTAGTPAKVETVLEPFVRAAYAKAPTQLLPAGSTVKVDPSSMKVTGNRATVAATVTIDGKSAPWTLLLSQVSGQWLVYGTKQ